MKKRRYHGHSGKRRLLAVMLAMAMLFGMSTISAYADEVAGKMPVEQVDVDVGQTDGESGGMQSGDSEQQADQESGMQENGRSETGSGESGLSEANSQDAAQPAEDVTESEPADAEAVDTESSPLLMSLQRSTAEKVVPEHHKYIRYNGNDSYTLTLDVKGAYASESVRPKVDVLLIIDKSGSMSEEIGSLFNRQVKMKVLKNVVSGTKGLTEAILGTNSTLDARMAVVSYSGNTEDGTYNDAWTEQTWTDNKATIDRSVNAMQADGGTNWKQDFGQEQSCLEHAGQTHRKS